MRNEWTEEDLNRCLEKVRERRASQTGTPKMATHALMEKLAGELWAMRGEGFSWEMIAETLHEGGVSITAGTLRSYLRGTQDPKSGGATTTAKRASAARKKRKRPPPKARTAAAKRGEGSAGTTGSAAPAMPAVEAESSARNGDEP